ncbi:hypothetical protein GCK32_011650, partial [Trichostrongylus colubriformis]
SVIMKWNITHTSRMNEEVVGKRSTQYLRMIP